MLEKNDFEENIRTSPHLNCWASRLGVSSKYKLCPPIFGMEGSKTIILFVVT